MVATVKDGLLAEGKPAKTGDLGNWYGSMGTGGRRVTGGVVKVLERGRRASREKKPGKEAEKPQNPHHHHLYHLSCSYCNQRDLFTS